MEREWLAISSSLHCCLHGRKDRRAVVPPSRASSSELWMPLSLGTWKPGKAGKSWGRCGQKRARCGAQGRASPARLNPKPTQILEVRYHTLVGTWKQDNRVYFSFKDMEHPVELGSRSIRRSRARDSLQYPQTEVGNNQIGSSQQYHNAHCSLQQPERAIAFSLYGAARRRRLDNVQCARHGYPYICNTALPVGMEGSVQAIDQPVPPCQLQGNSSGCYSVDTYRSTEVEARDTYT